MKWPPFLLLFLAFLFGCKPSPTSKVVPTESLKTAKVIRRDLDFTIDAIGDIQPSAQVDVKAEISGKIKKLHTKLGDTVSEGSPLVDLDDSTLLTEKAAAVLDIDGAKLSLEKAELTYERAQKLVKEDLITLEDADNKRIEAAIAQNNLDKAEKRLQTVEDRLSKTRIDAPISGLVINFPIVQGQVVIGGPSASQGTLLMTLANLSKMVISTHINQIDVVKMKPGLPVKITVDAIDSGDLNGTLQFIAPMATIKNNIKGFSVDILVPHPDARMRPGMSANVHIPIDHVTRTLCVPVECVFRENEESVVYLPKAEGWERRVVQVGISTVDYAEIKEGLHENDVIFRERPPSPSPTS